MMKSKSSNNQFAHPDGDHLTLINAYNAFIANGMDTKWCFKNYISDRNIRSAIKVREQLERIMLSHNIEINSIPDTSSLYSTAIRKSILSGYFPQVAHLQRSGNYMIVKDNQVVAIHPSSMYDARPEFILYHEFVLTSRNFIRIVRILCRLLKNR